MTSYCLCVLVQDYRELDMKLSDVAVNEYTSSELLRLVLRPNDQYDTASLTSDASDDDDADQDDVVRSSN